MNVKLDVVVVADVPSCDAVYRPGKLLSKHLHAYIKRTPTHLAKF